MTISSVHELDPKLLTKRPPRVSYHHPIRFKEVINAKSNSLALIGTVHIFLKEF